MTKEDDKIARILIAKSRFSKKEIAEMEFFIKNYKKVKVKKSRDSKALAGVVRALLKLLKKRKPRHKSPKKKSSRKSPIVGSDTAASARKCVGEFRFRMTKSDDPSSHSRTKKLFDEIENQRNIVYALVDEISGKKVKKSDRETIRETISESLEKLVRMVMELWTKKYSGGGRPAVRPYGAAAAAVGNTPRAKNCGMDKFSRFNRAGWLG